MKATQIILRLALLAGLTACVDLDEKLVGTLTSEYYASPDGLNAAVNSAYQNLQGWVGREQFAILGDYGTDIWTTGDQPGYKFFNDYGTQLNASDGWLSGTWSNFYRGINIDNSIIERAVGVTGMDPTVRDQRIGEAKFLRALNYFYLVQIWGDVYLTTTESKGVNTVATRSPADSVYLQIIKDLKEAVAVLPATQSDVGRATRWAAMHLLAKVYLTRAYQTATTFSTSFSRGSGETAASDFAAARVYADSVINSSGRFLVANYADLWCVARAADPNRDGYCDMTGLNEFSSEIIFSVQESHQAAQYSSGSGNYLHLLYLHRYDDRNGITRNINDGRPWRRLMPTEFSLNLWQRWTDATHASVLDTRYNGAFQNYWIGNVAAAGYTASACPAGLVVGGANCTSGQAFAVGDTVIWMPGYPVTLAFRQARKYWIIEPCMTMPAACPQTNTVGQYDWMRYATLKKHQDNLRQDFNWQDGGKDFPLMRLAETYLIAAEAAIGAGDQATALARLNVLRERARNKSAPAPYNTAGSLNLTAATLDTVLNESAREMIGECGRWFDLARTKQWSRITQYNHQAVNFNAAKHALRPIPQSQIDLTTVPFAQNPGY